MLREKICYNCFERYLRDYYTRNRYNTDKVEIIYIPNHLSEFKETWRNGECFCPISNSPFVPIDGEIPEKCSYTLEQIISTDDTGVC